MLADVMRGTGVAGCELGMAWQQVLAKGYDTVTGLGTPNGSAFIAGLRKGSGR